MKPLILLLLLLKVSTCIGQIKGAEHPEYRKIKASLTNGWGQYNTMNILSYTHLPEGFELQIDFRAAAGNYASSFMGPVLDFHQTAPQPNVRPLASDFKNYYSKVELT